MLTTRCHRGLTYLVFLMPARFRKLSCCFHRQRYRTYSFEDFFADRSLKASEFDEQIQKMVMRYPLPWEREEKKRNYTAHAV